MNQEPALISTITVDPVRVFIVAPPIAAWGLERLVQTRAPGFCIAGVQPNLEFLDTLPEEGRGDVVLVDLEGGGTIEALGRIPETVQRCVIVLTASSDVAFLLDRAVFAGVRGVVRKSESPQVLLTAIEKVHQGELWIDRSAASGIFIEIGRQKAAPSVDPEHHKIATLTSRERQAISALASDVAAPGKVIASRMCISEHTLRNHLSSIYSKLGLSNRLDLYAYATRHRLGSPNTAA